MRDLKDLLKPLGDRPMPDRWDSIQHREVGPMPEEPHRSRLGAGIAAGAIAILAIAVIAWLSPLGVRGFWLGAIVGMLVASACTVSYLLAVSAPGDARARRPRTVRRPV